MCRSADNARYFFRGCRLFGFKPTEYTICTLFLIRNSEKTARPEPPFSIPVHAAFPYPFYPNPFYLTRSLPEKLVISMFKQEFQMSVKPAGVLL